MNHIKHLAYATILTIIVAPLTYFALNSIYTLPQQASTQAEAIDPLFKGHFILISILFAIVGAFTLYSLITFRRQEGDDSDGEYIHGSTSLEIAWTVLPLFIVLGFGVWAWQVLDEVTGANLTEEEIAAEQVIEVTGRQWSWAFHYPNLGEFADDADLVLKVNQPVRLEMEATDVLHSFWVPEFRVKQDLIPGRTSTLRITPTEVGDYTLRCAEICGLSHAYMLADVQVLDEAEYAEWEEVMRSIGDLEAWERGQRIWEANCKSCHTIDGSEGVGPTWLNLLGREEVLTNGTTVIVDEAYIIQSILEPQSQIVAGFESQQMSVFNFEPRELSDIIAFMETLSDVEAPADN